MEFIPKVVQVVAGEGFTVYAYFGDGTVRILDAKPLLEKGGVFAPLRDARFFRDRLTVLNDTVRILDAKPLLEKGGVFAPLRDARFFRDRLTVLNDTVAWDVDGNRDPCTCVDLDPCQLYETCPVVVDPLREVI